MNPFAFSGLLAGVFSSILAIFAWFKSSNKELGRTWFFFAMSAAGWGFGSMAIALAKDPIRSLWIWRIADVFGVILIPACFFHFVCVFCEIRKPRLLDVHYTLAFLFFLFSQSHLFIPEVRWVFHAFYYAVPGSLYPLFLTWWVMSIIYSHVELIRHYKICPPEKKNQIKYFLLATIIGFSGGGLCYLPIFHVDVYPWGNFTIFIYSCIMSYAILKHRLMDINVIIRRTVVYSLVTSIVAVSIVFVVILSAHFTEGLLGRQTLYALAVAACFITAVVHPLQMKIQMVVDRFFSRGWQDREMVREVAAGFSHELKSPLAGLSMQAQLALAELQEVEDGKESWLKALPKIKRELQYLVNQSMDAARRIEAVRGVAEPIAGQIGPVDVSSIIESGLATFESRLWQADVSVRRDLPSDLPPVRSNEKQLEIVFINLIKNALDAMEGDNKERHKLSLSGQVENGSVLISVRDTGPGIASKDLDRIFEPYYSTKGRKGTGMGLYLTHQIVKAHGGSIDVRSEKGKGTEFIVRLSKCEKTKFVAA